MGERVTLARVKPKTRVAWTSVWSSGKSKWGSPNWIFRKMYLKKQQIDQNEQLLIIRTSTDIPSKAQG